MTSEKAFAQYNAKETTFFNDTLMYKVNDGVSNINITNTSSADMSVGKVTGNEGRGFIQLVDSAQERLTEYTSGKTRTIFNWSVRQI